MSILHICKLWNDLYNFKIKGDLSMAIRILSATYRIDDKIKGTVYPSDLTRESYNKKYKGNLYCPNEDWKAGILTRPANVVDC